MDWTTIAAAGVGATAALLCREVWERYQEWDFDRQYSDVMNISAEALWQYIRDQLAEMDRCPPANDRAEEWVPPSYAEYDDEHGIS